MRFFVINLDEDRVRLEKVLARGKELGVSMERFPAVCGVKIPNREKRSLVSTFKWHCIVGQNPTDGEIGCALSHLGVYAKMKDENIDVACILEDDVILDDKFCGQIEYVEKFCSLHEDSLILLSSKHRGGEEKQSIVLTPKENGVGAYGYVLTKNVAIKLLRVNTPLICPSDFFQWLCYNSSVSVYKAFPTVCDYDRGYMSKTIVGRKSVAEMSFLKRIYYKICRLFGLLIAHAFIRLKVW